jgi:hypothetical protein
MHRHEDKAECRKGVGHAFGREATDRKSEVLWNVHGMRRSGQQVIIHVWISTHFGVLSEQLPVADENSLHRGYVYRHVCNPVKPIRPTSFTLPPSSHLPAIPTSRSGAGGNSQSRCYAAGSHRHIGRLPAAAGSGSGAGRPASGLPQVGALLLGLLHQIQPFPSVAHQPRPLPEQVGIQSNHDLPANRSNSDS